MAKRYLKQLARLCHLGPAVQLILLLYIAVWATTSDMPYLDHTGPSFPDMSPGMPVSPFPPDFLQKFRCAQEKMAPFAICGTLTILNLLANILLWSRLYYIERKLYPGCMSQERYGQIYPLLLVGGIAHVVLSLLDYVLCAKLIALTAMGFCSKGPLIGAVMLAVIAGLFNLLAAIYCRSKSVADKRALDEIIYYAHAEDESGDMDGLDESNELDDQGRIAL